MGSIDEIMQVCRLCLVKDKVNIPIFDESNNSEEIFNKICSCLPVKVSREDNLPKKICDGCSYKLELLYTFRNTSVDSEKQLMSLLNQAGLSACSLNSTLVRDATKPEVLVKQETLEPADSRMENENSDVCPDAQSYIMQQQQLPYQQDFAFAEASGSSEVPTEEPPPKRARRSNPVKKPPVQTDSEDEDLDLAMQITKAEDEDSDDVDQPDYVEPSTSADDQPGPSGVGKDVVEAPLKIEIEETVLQASDDYGKYSPKEDKNDEDFEPTSESNEDSDEDYVISSESDEEFKRPRIMRKLTERTFGTSNKTKQIQVDAQPRVTYDTKSEAYVCNDCSAEFQDETEAEAHYEKTHVESYPCRNCKKNFDTIYDYCYHMQQHNAKKVFICPLCSYNTPRKHIMTEHIKIIHFRNFKYRCTICARGFEELSYFQDHDNVHKGLKPYVCIVCSKSYAYFKHLDAHQIRYHKVAVERLLGKNQCEICLRTFARKRSLKYHVASKHSGDKKPPKPKRHLCDICGKGFPTTDKHKIHYRVHTGVKPFACKYCKKSFAKKDTLVTHERVHTGERPYACEFCGKMFNQRTPLTIHIRGHTGEKPYVCQFCSRGFVSKSGLDNHKKKCSGVAK